MSSFREDLPGCAESVDFLKTLFGDDVKVEAAYEGVESVETKAKKAEAEMIEIDGAHFLRLGKLIEMENKANIQRDAKAKK
jgi:hypothetical protein